MRTTTKPITSQTFVITLVAGILASGAAVGQVVPPAPLAQPQPETPNNRFGMPMEGWAVVRYSVLADGKTANVRVIDLMPEMLPDRGVRQAVEAWTFQPATRNGAAVEWHNNESVIVFDVDTIPAEPSPRFVTGYREVETLLAEDEPEDALQRNRRLLATETTRLAEMGVGLVQNARLNIMLGNLHAAYAAIQRATDPRRPLLEPSELTVALEYRNTLELGLGDVVAALDTFARRQQLGPVPDSDRMASNIAAIELALDSDRAIAVKGEILDEDWSHTMARRTFAIGDLDGDLRRINVECDQQTAELEYSEESEWSLPESWGACTVFVAGRRNTEFVFYEFQ
jgi:TonB family protein